MFQWYRNAAVCYTYLCDLEWSADPTILEQRLRECRWFTRGWTLQELIAPRDIQFFSMDWRKVSSKEQLRGVLSSITGIDEHILRGGSLADVSLARKMSWAARRKTSRPEDIAYCLLGIFDVNLPLIYGEGLKAFRRLQEVILNTTHDQSLFAWGRVVSRLSNAINAEQVKGRKAIPWKPLPEREPLFGLFARAPADFEFSGDIAAVDNGYAHQLNRGLPPTVVNGGVLLNLVIPTKLTSATYWDDLEIAVPDQIERAILLCRYGTTGSTLIGLALHSWGDGYYSRTAELFHIDMYVSHYRFHSWTQPRHIMPHRQFGLRNGDILLRRWESDFKAAGKSRPVTKSGPAWRQKWQDKILRLEEVAEGDEDVTYFYETWPGEGIAFMLRRVTKTRHPIGPLLVGAYPIGSIEAGDDAGVSVPRWSPKDGDDPRFPALRHIMKAPSDSWTTSIGADVQIRVKVNRVALCGGEPGAVDVLDFYMYSFDASSFDKGSLSRS